MKKIERSFIVFLTILFYFCAPSFAVSWAGVIDNTTKFSENHDFSEPAMEQSNGVYLSVRAPISEKGSLVFDAEVLYKYNLKAAFKTNKTTFKNIVDCDLLRLSGSWKLGNGTFNMNAGRFFANDSNGTVFNQISDGLSLVYSAKKIDFKVYAGYTGLLNRINVSMTDNAVVAEDKDDFYRLCPQYIPVIADFSYKTLFNRHTIGLQGEAFFPVSDKLSQKTYGTIYLRGPISTNSSYSAFFTVGAVKFEKFMLDGSLDFNVFISNGMITAGAEYLSSASDSLIAFTSITSRTVTNDPLFAGGVIPKISYMYAKGKLYASITGKGVISMANNNTKFHGIDASGTVVFNIFSDLQITGIIDAFIGMDEAKKSSNYAATLKAALQF